MPDGDVYLLVAYSEMCRVSVAVFRFDIDLSVEGDWERRVKYLVSLGARLNKFGGFLT